MLARFLSRHRDDGYTAMIPKRELTQEQIEEIQALRGRLTADEVKKRFCIGSSRLYKIWRDAQKALPDRVTADLPPPARRGDAPRRNLGAKMEQSRRLLMEVMAQLVRMEE